MFKIFVLILGLPATGKTLLSNALTKKIKAVHLNTDVIRKKFFKKPKYSEAEKKKVYSKLFNETLIQLKKGKTVIVDGTFYKKSLRNQARDTANKANAKFLLIECTCPEKEIKRRMGVRAKIKTDSDADFNVYKKIKKQFQPVKKRHFLADTSNVYKLPVKEVVGLINKTKYSLNLPNDLIKPNLFPGSKKKPELKQTHISWVFLTEKNVFKIKKPVNFGFLDFSSLKKRKHFCEQELKLNSRLSKGIYQKIIPIAIDSNGRINFSGKGKIVDYAVKMKRLPEKNKMDLLLKKNKVTKKHVKQIAEQISKFHKKTKSVRKKEFGSPKSIKLAIDDLLSVKHSVQKYAGKTYAKKIDFILDKSAEFIKINSKLLLERQKKGKIIEAHGDLHSGNIFLLKKPVIFDCIEFNKDFRFIDVASEIAFMAMDLDAFGKKKLAEEFVSAYVSKNSDEDFMALLPFYKCYRANVRAKVNSLQLGQNLDSKTKKIAINSVKKYLDLAEKYAKQF